MGKLISLLVMLTAGVANGQSLGDRLATLRSQLNQVVGGVRSCPKISAADVTSFDCHARANILQPFDANSDLENLVERLILTEMASDAQDSVGCFLPMLKAYQDPAGASDASGIRKKINDAAYTKFSAMLGDLTTARDAQNGLRQEFFDELRTCRGRSEQGFEFCQNRILEKYEPRFTALDHAVTAMLSSMPLGQVESIRTGAFALVKAGKTDQASFNAMLAEKIPAFAKEMQDYKDELDSAVDRKPDGARSFDFNKMPVVREQLMVSDQYTQKLRGYGATASLENAMMCRLDGEFENGPARVKAGVTALSVLAMAASFGASALAEGAGAATLTTVAGARTANIALQIGVMSAMVADTTLDLAAKCGAGTVFVPKANPVCSLDEAFNGVVARAQASECVHSAGVGFITLAGLGGLSLRAATKATTAIARKFPNFRFMGADGPTNIPARIHFNRTVSVFERSDVLLARKLSATEKSELAAIRGFMARERSQSYKGAWNERMDWYKRDPKLYAEIQAVDKSVTATTERLYNQWGKASVRRKFTENIVQDAYLLAKRDGQKIDMSFFKKDSFHGLDGPIPSRYFEAALLRRLESSGRELRVITGTVKSDEFNKSLDSITWDLGAGDDHGGMAHLVQRAFAQEVLGVDGANAYFTQMALPKNRAMWGVAFEPTSRIDGEMSVIGINLEFMGIRDSKVGLPEFDPSAL